MIRNVARRYVTRDVYRVSVVTLDDINAIDITGGATRERKVKEEGNKNIRMI
jgi:hypothetical protein